ncbi:MAG: CRISPR-associated endoribonuclease Cas6 [Candidatus Aenigmatarchaeota archaeon]
MRIFCKIELKENTPIPNNFRQGVVSLIKEAIKRGSDDGELFYRFWYSTNKPKPFTFSAFFPLKSVEGRSVFNGGFFKLIISTNNIDFLVRFYNGILELDKTGYYLYGQPIKLKHCNFLPEKRFSNEVVKFKTLSPFLIRDPKDGDYYLYPIKMTNYIDTKFQKFKYWKGIDIKDFERELEENITINTKSKVKILDFELHNVVPVFCGSKRSNFSVTYPGIKASFKIEAEKEILKLIYDIGIGARRSEGFGMLEVENE